LKVDAGGRRRAVIWGGSIAGLTAGLLLRDQGWEVDVFERAASILQGRGAGIATHKMSLRYLVERHLASMEEVSVPARVLRYLNPDGTVRYQEMCGHRFTSWNTLYGHLLQAFGPDRYHFSSALETAEQRTGAVSVRVQGGERLECDLLVCADGTNSTGRRLLFPEAKPTYAGYVAWRGTVPESSLPLAAAQDLSERLTYQLLPSSHIVAYNIPGEHAELGPERRLLNFVWYRNVEAGAELADLMTGVDGVRRDLSMPPGSVRRAFLAEVSEAACGLAPSLREMVLRTEQPFVQAIHDLEVPGMALGRICLVGDAAFTARPHPAAGAAKAAADAWALAESVGNGQGDLDAALQAWSESQSEVGRRLVARARDIGNRSQFLGTWVPGDPFLRYGLWEPGN
jgi:2,6-dihydroxypyridine 3-monooxygenase